MTVSTAYSQFVDRPIHPGPYRVVSADTGQEMRGRRFRQLHEAFWFGDMATFNKDRDYRVLDRHGRKVPRSVIK